MCQDSNSYSKVLRVEHVPLFTKMNVVVIFTGLALKARTRNAEMENPEQKTNIKFTLESSIYKIIFKNFL